MVVRDVLCAGRKKQSSTTLASVVETLKTELHHSRKLFLHRLSELWYSLTLNGYCTFQGIHNFLKYHYIRNIWAIVLPSTVLKLSLHWWLSEYIYHLAKDLYILGNISTTKANNTPPKALPPTTQSSWQSYTLASFFNGLKPLIGGWIL